MSNAILREVVDKAHEGKSFNEILSLSPAALQGVSDKDAEALKTAFGIKTVGDLANNKFFLAAQALQALAKYE